MKPATQALRDTLIQDMAIHAQPRLIAEWEYNRYFTPTVTVTPDQSAADTDWTASYDLNSIVLPFRPTAGIARMRSDGGVHPLDGQYRDPGDTRFYPTPDAPLYSYFASWQRSELAKVDDAYPFDEKIVVTAMYAAEIATNKIVIGFEKGYALPASFSIQISPDGNAWQTINTDTVIDPDGTITLWHGGGIGSGWGGTGWDTAVVDYDSPVVIRGVRINVYSLNQPYSHLDLIQISPRLENDLTAFLVKYEVDMSQDSPSFIAPLGKASSNTASLTLSNIDGRFNNENKDSLYYGMIEKKVRFKMDLGIDTSNHGGSGMEYIREFTMWTDGWGAQDNSTIDVQLKDSSVVLQESTMPSMFLQNATVGAVVWQTLDTVGMTNYQYTRSDPDYGQVIPFYWPSDTAEASNPRWGRMMVSTATPPTTTIWDELSSLCESTQTALFFDEYDVLQIKSREAMYNTGKSVDWNLDAVRNGVKMPDVVDAQANWDLTTNQVEVTYKPCAMSDDNNGFPKMETVWAPTARESTSIVPAANDSTSTDTVVLRASALSRDLFLTGTDLWIHQADAAYWPYESDVNIEGEFLHYKGKEYAYYDASGNLTTGICQTLDDQKSYDAKNDLLSFKNTYTGRMIVTERGVYGSTKGDHVTQSTSYASLLVSSNHAGNQALGTGWTKFNDGYITQTTPNADSTKFHVRIHNQAVVPQGFTNGRSELGSNAVWYGAKIRLPGAATGAPDATQAANWRSGGIYFAGDAIGNGYYLEFTPTTQIDGWEQRRFRHELCLVALPAGGNSFSVSSSTGDILGHQAAVLEDTWYQIDISFTENDNNGNTRIAVFLNGVSAGVWLLGPGVKPVYGNAWRFGTIVLGPSLGQDIEYLYAIGEDDINPYSDPDQDSFLDIVSGGYQSRFMRNNIIYSSPLAGFEWPSGYDYFPDPLDSIYCVFDEFGPVVHEVRQFDVEFSSQYIPVASSYLYLTNSSQVECISYVSDASGASFLLANASRQNAIVNGEDTISFGADNSVQQTLSVYGRVVYTAQNDSTKIIKDDAAIRKQGLIRTQFTSRYIQTDVMAGVIGDWILSLWATGVDQVDVNLFGNPLLQPGDLVTMNFPSKGMTPSSHKYYVTAVKGNFEKGYTTSATLRRARV